MRVTDTHGKEIWKAQAVREGNTVTVTFEPLPAGARVLLRNIDSIRSVSGAEASRDPLGTLLHLHDKTAIIELA